MSRYRWMFAAALGTIALPWAACGEGHTGGAGGADGGATCAGGGFDEICEPCIEKSCCSQAAACYADALCSACLTGTEMAPTECAVGMSPAYDAFVSCVTDQCQAQCLPRSSCNPVTNEGCDTGAGQACDVDVTGVYGCFDTLNDVTLCGACSNGTDGPFCEPTMHCLTDPTGNDGLCARYCCGDGDCGGGTCDKSMLPEGVGICVATYDAGVGPACSAPATAPSHGACFTIPSPDGGAPADAGSTPPADGG